MPLRIYDVTIDAWRTATQKDIDCYSALTRAWGRVMTAQKYPSDTALRRTIDEAFNELMVAIGVDAEPRGRMPDDTPERGGRLELAERGVL